MARSARIARFAMAALVAAHVAVLAAFGAQSFFFQDDFFYLQLADQQGLTWTNLSGNVFGSFAPLFKLVYHPILGILSVNYTVVLIGELACAAGIVYATWRLITLFVAPTLGAVAAVATTCFTTMWIPTILWPADALHVLPALLLMLISLEGALRYDLERDKRWLAGALVAFVIALGFWSKALLVPVYLVLLVVFVLEPDPRRVPRALLERWPVWVLYALPAAAFSIFVLTDGQYSRGATEALTLHRMVHVVGTAWATGFFPGLFGLGALKPRLGLPIADPALLPTAKSVIIAAQLILVVIVGVALYRRPAAWRLFAFFVVAFAANQLYMAYGRGHEGTVIGREYRYMIDLAPLFAVVLAMAYGRVTTIKDSPLGSAPRALPAQALPVACALIGCGLAVQVVREVHGGKGIKAEFPVNDTRHYVHNFRHDINRIERTDKHPALFDAPMPGNVMTGGFYVFSVRKSFLHVLSDKLRFPAVVTPNMYDVAEDGHVYPARIPPQGALDIHAKVMTQGGATAAVKDGALCLTGPGTVRMPLKLAAGPFSSQRTQIALRYTAPTASAPLLWLTSEAGEQDAFANLTRLPIEAGQHSYLRPLRDNTLTAGIRLDLDPKTTVCLQSLVIGKPVATAPNGAAQ